jgi:hypothetical protein
MFVLWFMERFVPLLRMNWDHELFLRKSGIGLPHSTTLARITACHSFREVVECGSPYAAFAVFCCGIRKPDARFVQRAQLISANRK